MLIETRLGNAEEIKAKTEQFIIKQKQFINEERQKLKEQIAAYDMQLKVLNDVMPDKGLKEFTKADCCRSLYDDLPEGKTDNEGCVCIIPLDKLEKKYRKPEYQLFRIQSGFGTRPSARGNACYGYFCADGEQCRWERYKFLGVGNAEVEKIAEKLEAGWSGECALVKDNDEGMEM